MLRYLKKSVFTHFAMLRHVFLPWIYGKLSSWHKMSVDKAV